MRFSPLQLLVVVALNTTIAAFLLALGIAQDFTRNLVGAQSIGLSIYATSLAVSRWITRPGMRLIGHIAAIPAGSVIGIAISRLLLRSPGTTLDMSAAGQSMLIALIFGTAITAVFALRERMVKLQSELRAQQLREMEIDKQRIKAQLKMLQAQIEPHFLFNTLANVSGLIDADPQKARALLEHLNLYLRATLSRVRAEQTRFSDEVELLKAYVDVVRIRMGGRLAVAFDIAPALMSQPFPSMLIQPLVENAIKHGIEPKLGDGSLQIVAGEDGKRWHVEVRDDGVGLASKPGAGVGLANVRERLAALYANAATLTIAENPAGGVISRIELPRAEV